MAMRDHAQLTFDGTGDIEMLPNYLLLLVFLRSATLKVWSLCSGLVDFMIFSNLRTRQEQFLAIKETRTDYFFKDDLGSVSGARHRSGDSGVAWDSLTNEQSTKE